MKKILYGFLSLAALTFVSCDYNNPNDGGFGDDPQSGWIQFDEDKVTTFVLSGTVTEFSVPVTLMAPVNTDGLTVNYQITDIEGVTAGYVTYTGQVEVPKNTVTGNIQFSIPADALTSCVKYKITLTGTSRSNVQVGLIDDVKPIEHVVTIGKGRDSFIGTYDALETPGDWEYTMTVTAGEEPNELLVHNLYDADEVTKIYLDPVSFTGTVSYPFFEENYLLSNDDGDFYVTDDFIGIGGEDEDVPSFFDPCSNSLDLSFLLTSDGTTVGAQARVVMTKQ